MGTTTIGYTMTYMFDGIFEIFAAVIVIIFFFTFMVKTMKMV